MTRYRCRVANRIGEITVVAVSEGKGRGRVEAQQTTMARNCVHGPWTRGASARGNVISK